MVDIHYRKDSPNGITAPNPDVNASVVDHVTKARGKRTQFTSVSESEDAIRRFSGDCYRCSRSAITSDGHSFTSHSDLVQDLRDEILKSRRADKIKAERALQYATRAREALVHWRFDLRNVPRKDRITHCGNLIQKFFERC